MKNNFKMRAVWISMVGLIFLIPVISSAKDARLEYVKKQLVSSGVDQVDIDKLFTDKRLKLYPLKIVAYKQPNWKIIEKKLYSKSSVKKGRDYIKQNQEAFDKAEQDFGVKKEVLAGIIAIETDFGKKSGDYPIFNVIYSRLERWPSDKWKGQASELIALSRFCLKSGLDCLGIKGSYAGAFGLVQFMPSSVLAYGVDGDGDGVIDLSKPIDAVPSAAKFLKGHGWLASPNQGKENNQLKALAGYYGSSIGYPKIVLIYASLLVK